MKLKKQLNEDPLTWLLEPENPGVRYMALRDILERPVNDPEFVEARFKVYSEGPISEILEAISTEGYWIEPGPGYLPKYRSTVWALILLGQLGAAVDMDSRIATGIQYLLEHTLTQFGQFSGSGTPSGTVDCLQGNLCSTLLDLGFTDSRLDLAFEWMARSLTGEGVAPVQEKSAPLRYYAGKCGPGFACGANNKLPCAWGAAKVMLAFSKLPLGRRTSLINNAIAAGIDFLFSVDPATAAYPCGWNEKPSRNWWKFGFPVFYVTDLLQITEALVGLGFGHDPRLSNTIKLILEKQDCNGRWPLEYDYSGKTWGHYGSKKQPNKWITLRVLKVLKQL